MRQTTPRPATATPTGKTATPVVRTATPAGKTTPPEGTSLEQQAQLDLAGRLGLAAEDVEIVSSSKTEMPTGSLGCGQAAATEAPGLIIGDEIVLQAGGKEYVYRSDGRWLLPCRPVPFPGGSERLAVVGTSTADFKVRTLAIADLAERLGIARSAITVKEVVEAQWRDSSLGCPQPGMMYLQVITPGYQIVLEANGKTYTYHTSRSQVVLCEK